MPGRGQSRLCEYGWGIWQEGWDFGCVARTINTSLHSLIFSDHACKAGRGSHFCSCSSDSPLLCPWWRQWRVWAVVQAIVLFSVSCYLWDCSKEPSCNTDLSFSRLPVLLESKNCGLWLLFSGFQSWRLCVCFVCYLCWSSLKLNCCTASWNWVGVLIALRMRELPVHGHPKVRSTYETSSDISSGTMWHTSWQQALGLSPSHPWSLVCYAYLVSDTHTLNGLGLEFLVCQDHFESRFCALPQFYASEKFIITALSYHINLEHKHWQFQIKKRELRTPPDTCKWVSIH